MLLDTPGVLALPSRSDDERATMRALLEENTRCLVQVGDAKNLRRTLTLTALLAELGVPLVLALNMHDEAAARGVTVNIPALAEELGIPVLATVATGGEGVSELTGSLPDARPPQAMLRYDADFEREIARTAEAIARLAPHPHLAARGLAILFLGGDPEVAGWLAGRAGARFADLEALRRQAGENAEGDLPALLARERTEAADALSASVIQRALRSSPLLSQRIGQYVVHPLWGVPILLGVLYLVYQFVGVFGATVLVGLLEKDLFEGILNPAFTDFVTAAVNVPWITELLVGQYGLWTMGMTYALALILPIVTTFFLAFGVLEDSGYLPRLTVIANRLFALIGLNGRAVLPMVLGLGCVTMATLTTRILHSPRERMITIFLLALAIPCSAQLGVVLGMLGGVSFSAVLIWALAMVLVLLLSGFLAARLIPGRRIPLVTELPPMRLPILGNVLKKTGGPAQVVSGRSHPALPARHLHHVRARQAGRPARHHPRRRTAGFRLARPAQGSLGRLRHGLPAPRLRRHRPVRHGAQPVAGSGRGRHDHHHAVHSVFRQPDDDGQGTGFEGRPRHGRRDRPLRLPRRRPVQHRPARPLDAGMSPKHEARLPLAFIPAGQEVRLAGFGDEIDPLQREQLIAYGLAESRPLKVLQQRPMTVILADEVELALEHAVARHIWVEKEAGEA